MDALKVLWIQQNLGCGGNSSSYRCWTTETSAPHFSEVSDVSSPHQVLCPMAWMASINCRGEIQSIWVWVVQHLVNDCQKRGHKNAALFIGVRWHSEGAFWLSVHMTPLHIYKAWFESHSMNLTFIVVGNNHVLKFNMCGEIIMSSKEYNTPDTSPHKQQFLGMTVICWYQVKNLNFFWKL